MECKHCQILKNRENFIFETKHWIVTLNSEQSYLGRSRAILKRHCGGLSDLKEEELLDFLKVIKKFESTLKKAFNATMFNWTSLMNDAYLNKPANPHVHWHPRPRYNHKVKLVGKTFVDPEFSTHYNRKRKQEVSKEIQKVIIDKIKENLE